MKRPATALAFGLGMVLMTAASADAQLWFFPDYAVPSAFGTPSSFVAGTYGRGLNDVSGKLNAYGLIVGRTGLGERISVMAGAGLIDDVESEWTIGGSVGVDVLEADATTQLSVQGGVGWLDVDFLGETLTTLRFPIGVALKRRIEGESASVTPWVMPRLNISRVSGLGSSDTEADFGASAGVGVTMTSGFGLHAALDVLAANSTVWFVGVGAHYVIR